MPRYLSVCNDPFKPTYGNRLLPRAPASAGASPTAAATSPDRCCNRHRPLLDPKPAAAPIDVGLVLDALRVAAPRVQASVSWPRVSRGGAAQLGPAGDRLAPQFRIAAEIPLVVLKVSWVIRAAAGRPSRRERPRRRDRISACGLTSLCWSRFSWVPPVSWMKQSSGWPRDFWVRLPNWIRPVIGWP